MLSAIRQEQRAKTRRTGKHQGAIWALGCMSGTSMDGVDVAMIRTDGDQIMGFGPAGFEPFTADQRRVLARAQGAWPGDDPVAPAAQIIEQVHVAAIQPFLAGDPAPELLGFHGQTLAHDPRAKGTHQAGDGQALADVLGLPVVWDFRSRDVQMGGEGAPLAPFFHHACARFLGADAPMVFLNLGGVGNLTWVDPRLATPEAPGACLAFDTGPANAPMDDVMQARRGQSRDDGGALALAGRADDDIVARLLTYPYFSRTPPKSLDRNDFNNIVQDVEQLCDQDALRTLTACAAASVVRGLEHCPTAPTRVLVTGGGRHNAALMEELRARTPVPVDDIDQTGLDGDMLEAQAFAYLALRVARGLPISAPGTTGVGAPMGGGIVSQPAR